MFIPKHPAPRISKFLPGLSLLLSLFPLMLFAAPPEPAQLPSRPLLGSVQLNGTPDPPSPFITRRLFPQLKFTSPVDLTNAPGSPRFFLAEQGGKIFSFPIVGNPEQADLVVDLKQSIPDLSAIYALTFHPQFETNHYCYVCLILKNEDPKGTRISRFTFRPTDPPTLDPASELPLVEWLSGGHNGCCLKFGPDGYLYISTGDATAPSPPDGLETGQNLTDLLSCILRIDVDHPGPQTPYTIPPDNPFVNVPGARGEIWAYGFRNPWRMSFAPDTGTLWVGDVGWELWELLYRVEKGGNYGWSIMEGSQPVRPAAERGPTPISPPFVQLPHSESASITGGIVYRGKQLPELSGDYVYGDWETGKFWAVRDQNGQPHNQRELVDTPLRPISFAEDNQGELYILDYSAGGIHQLAVNDQRGLPSSFPRKLSETGLFQSTPEQIPATGVIPYEINAPQWEDGRLAARWAALPGTQSVDLHNDPNSSFKNPLAYPEQSIFVKTLSLPLSSSGEKPRPVETQILHIHEGYSRGYSYRWNSEGTDADLVGPDGDEATFSLNSGDQTSQYRWRFHSRAECARCHNQWCSFVIGFTPSQLDREITFQSQSINQLQLFRHWNLFSPAVESPPELKRANPYAVDSGSLEERARTYLDTNCAHCHRMSGGGSTNIELVREHLLDKTKAIAQRPLQGSFGLLNGEIIAPGDPYRSVLFYRLQKTGSGHMPHIGSVNVDDRGLQLIHDWIAQLPASASPPPSEQTAAAEIRKAEDRLAAELLQSDLSREETLSQAAQLLTSSRGASRLAYVIAQQQLPPELRDSIVDQAASHPEPAVRDLFERFLPEERRIVRLGAGIRPERILSTPGDAARGRQLFEQASHIACRNCHIINRIGRDVGPDLSLIARKYPREKILQEILDPSRTIEQKYLTYVVETKAGKVHSGLLIERRTGHVSLRNIQGELLVFEENDIENLAPQSASLMPEGQLKELQIQEASDLLEFLGSLK